MPERPGEVAITGQCYSIRERLKELGGRWDPEDRCWYVPEAQAAAAKHAYRTRPPEWKSPNRWSPPDAGA